MPQISNLMNIFGVFDTNSQVLSADEIAARLGCRGQETIRYVNLLCDNRFLMRFDGSYALGPRIIELAHCLRQSGPLLNAARPSMRMLRDRMTGDVTLVQMSGDHPIEVHRERSDGTKPVHSRGGRRMQLLSDPGSQIVLAHLPVARQKHLFNRSTAAVKRSTRFKTWDELRTRLRKIRKDGFVVSLADSGLEIAVPILDGSRAAIAALALALPAGRFDRDGKKMLVNSLKDAAAEISFDVKFQIQGLASAHYC